VVFPQTKLLNVKLIDYNALYYISNFAVRQRQKYIIKVRLHATICRVRFVFCIVYEHYYCLHKRNPLHLLFIGKFEMNHFMRAYSITYTRVRIKHDVLCNYGIICTVGHLPQRNAGFY
jgi:hypothetical protein